MKKKKGSRQIRWMNRMKAMGRCICCGARAVNKNHCERHRDIHRAAANRAYQRKQEFCA